MTRKLLLDMLYRLKKKDVATYEHSIRVGKLAKIMASALHLNSQQTYDLVAGCLLHDIGKIHIPDELIKKESPLTVSEWEVMKFHPVLGANWAAKEGIENKCILEIIEYHHERWDGAGYPYGLRGNFIPIFARICTIIDAFDSMVHDRSYRKGMSAQEAKDELLYQSQKQFDKNLVQIFLKIPVLQMKTSQCLTFHIHDQETNHSDFMKNIGFRRTGCCLKRDSSNKELPWL